MSLVGTRPPTVDEWDKYELHHRARLATKPGLTGMWQVSGRSNITDFKDFNVILQLFIPTAALQIYAIVDKTMIGEMTAQSVQNGYYEQAEKIVNRICLY